MVPTTAVLSELAQRINAEHKAAESAAQSALGHALAAGKLLMEAKTEINHGEWSAWLAGNFEGSGRTARAYMRVAKHWPAIEAKRQTTAILTIDDALQMLVEPKPQEPIDKALDLKDRFDRMQAPKRLAELQERFDKAETVAECAAVAHDARLLHTDLSEVTIRAQRAVGQILNSTSGRQHEVLKLVAENPDVDFTPAFDERIRELEKKPPDIPLPDLRPGFKFSAFGQCAAAGPSYIEITPSADWPGYWYVAVYLDLDSDCAAVEYNKRAVKHNAALLQSLLAGYGFTPNGEWQEEPCEGAEPWYVTAPGKPGRAVGCLAGANAR